MSPLPPYSAVPVDKDFVKTLELRVLSAGAEWL